MVGFSTANEGAFNDTRKRAAEETVQELLPGPFTPLGELELRRRRFAKKLAAHGVDGALITDCVDLFYLAGTSQLGYLYVSADEREEPLLLVRKSFPRARAESALPQVEPLPSVRRMPEILAAYGFAAAGRIGLELDVLPASTYLFLQGLFPKAEFVDISAVLRHVRAVKSAYELALIRRAAEVAERMLQAATDRLSAAVAKGIPSELELATVIESAGRLAGHQGYIRMRAFNQSMYFGHIVAGPAAALPSFVDSPTGGPGLSAAFPQGAGGRAIRRDEPILMDFVAASAGYLVDQTRVACIGRLRPELERAYQVALDIQAELVRLAVPGVTAARLFEVARDMAAEAGLAEHFMGVGDSQARFVGHGVGLELDEPPALASGVETPLEAGMTIAVEPKFTFPGVGVIGIENTFSVTPEGLVKLNLPDDELIIL